MAQYALWRSGLHSWHQHKQVSDCSLKDAFMFMLLHAFLCLIICLYIYVIQLQEPCIIYYWNPCMHVCLPELNYAGLSVLLVNQVRASLFLNSKINCESYIFYKLSAIKEGAKIKTINTVHFLLPQPIVSSLKSLLQKSATPVLTSLLTEHSIHFSLHGKRNLFRSLNVKTLTHARGFGIVMVLKRVTDAL